MTYLDIVGGALLKQPEDDFRDVLEYHCLHVNRYLKMKRSKYIRIYILIVDIMT